MSRVTNKSHTTTLASTSLLELDGLSLSFHRTCRVPRVEGRSSDLPASLGSFPIYRVSDFQGNVPPDWKVEGHLIPMYEHEAMWISFSVAGQPVAVMLGAGMVNALTGERMTPTLSAKPQNYVVCPTQRWLDGFKPTSGERVYQFVAAQLGNGETAEEQILGTAEFGGLQIGVFKPKVALIVDGGPTPYGIGKLGLESLLTGWHNSAPRLQSFARGSSVGSHFFMENSSSTSVVGTSFNAISANLGAGQDARAMGLGAGGSIRQKIYQDPYLLGRDVNEVWHAEPSSKAYIYIVHANDFQSITGHPAPASPITYATYKQQGIPWFGMSDGTWGDVEGGAPIDTLMPVSGGPHPTDLNALSVDPQTKNLW